MTTADAAVGRNFGFAGASEHGARYARARECTELVHALWDSWADDAFLGDKANGRLADTEKVHAIRHRGAHYAVAGPLTVPGSPQGCPVGYHRRG